MIGNSWVKETERWTKNAQARQLKQMHHFFHNTIECFSEQDSQFAPQPGMFTVSQLVGPTAGQSIGLGLLKGAFDPQGFDMGL